jgi:hypothetical protein
VAADGVTITGITKIFSAGVNSISLDNTGDKLIISASDPIRNTDYLCTNSLDTTLDCRFGLVSYNLTTSTTLTTTNLTKLSDFKGPNPMMVRYFGSYAYVTSVGNGVIRVPAPLQ